MQRGAGDENLQPYIERVVDQELQARVELFGWPALLPLFGVWAALMAATFTPVMRPYLGEPWIVVSVGTFLLATVLGVRIVLTSWGLKSRAWDLTVLVQPSVLLAGMFLLIFQADNIVNPYWLWVLYWVLDNANAPYPAAPKYATYAVLGVLLVVAVWFRDGAAIAVSYAFIVLTLVLFGFPVRAARSEARLSRARNEQLLDRIAEIERDRMRRDLHDGLGAELTALLWTVRSMDLSEGTRDEIEQRVAAALGELRGIVSDSEAYTSWGDALATIEGRLLALAPAVSVATIASDDHTEVDPVLVASALRTAQEAVNNALRHGAASRVDVELRLTEEWLEVVVADDGVGISAQTPERGLAGLRRRAAELDGSLDVRRQQVGTRVELRLPRNPHS